MTDSEALHPLRPFLKNWVWEHGHVGTRYLDCSDGAVKIDDGKKARFAAEKIFYVSLRKDADDAAHVAGPAIPRGSTCAVLARCPTRQTRRRMPGRWRMCNARCKTSWSWVWSAAYQQEAQSALARYALEPMFDDEIRAEVIKDIRRMYMGLREQLALYDFTVFHGLPTPLLTNEAPFIDWRVRAQPPQLFVSLPLGPLLPAGRHAVG